MLIRHAKIMIKETNSEKEKKTEMRKQTRIKTVHSITILMKSSFLLRIF